MLETNSPDIRIPAQYFITETYVSPEVVFDPAVGCIINVRADTFRDMASIKDFLLNELKYGHTKGDTNFRLAEIDANYLDQDGFSYWRNQQRAIEAAPIIPAQDYNNAINCHLSSLRGLLMILLTKFLEEIGAGGATPVVGELVLTYAGLGKNPKRVVYPECYHIFHRPHFQLLYVIRSADYNYDGEYQNTISRIGYAFNKHCYPVREKTSGRLYPNVDFNQDENYGAMTLPPPTAVARLAKKAVSKGLLNRPLRERELE